jgi:hypothetical protein
LCSPLPETTFNPTLIVSGAQIDDDEPERLQIRSPRPARDARTSTLGMSVRSPREHYRLTQDIEVADFVYKDQDKLGV